MAAICPASHFFKRAGPSDCPTIESLKGKADDARSKDSVAPRSNVLFVCVGNSCRSQMAEALANHLGQGRVHAWSAGSRPAGMISAVAQTVMREQRLSMDGQWSKGLEEFQMAEMDVVVTMGCEVECPMPKGFTGRLVEWNIPDPGDDLQLGREVRGLIERQVTALLAEL
jgi:arsenate reductase